MHPALLLSLMFLWGGGSMYLFATGIGELIQINHEMTEALTKGHTTLHSDQTALVQINVGWRLITGTVLLGLAIPLFRRIYSWRRVF